MPEIVYQLLYSYADQIQTGVGSATVILKIPDHFPGKLRIFVQIFITAILWNLITLAFTRNSIPLNFASFIQVEPNSSMKL